MKNVPEYIKILLSIKENIQNKTTTRENMLPIYTSFEDNLKKLLREYEITNDFRCKNDKLNISYSAHIENYLSALILSIRITKTYNDKNATSIGNDLFKNRPAEPHKLAFKCSTFNSLLLYIT